MTDNKEKLLRNLRPDFDDKLVKDCIRVLYGLKPAGLIGSTGSELAGKIKEVSNEKD